MLPRKNPPEPGEYRSPPARSRKARRQQRYQLLEEIGSGGMGMVYRALDQELNRTVAVKVIRPEFSSDFSSLLRLKREVILASRVNSNHVVRVHDFGEVGGRPLIAMDFVDGENLAAVLARVHTLPPSQVCDFAAQIAAALRDIHAAGIVHRDLKPGNLLLNRSGAVLVADFGLARSALPREASLTIDDISGGTPRYMAPEQLAGLPANARSDLYSLGMVLLELLTGATALEALAQVRERWIHAPAAARVRFDELRKLAALDLVIRHCLQPDRTERYAGAVEVLRDLKLADAAATDAALPAAVARSPFRRAAIAAAAVLLLVALMWGTYHLRRRPAASSTQLYGQAIGLMGPAGSEADLRQAARDLAEALAQQPHYLPALRARLDVCLRLSEETGDERMLVDARATLHRATAAGMDESERMLYLAKIDLRERHYSEVIRNLEGGVALLASSDQANRLMGRALEATGRLAGALSFYRAAVRLSPESWLSHNDLASLLRATGHLAEAGQQFREVIRLNPDSAAGYSNLGVTLLEAGKLEGAQQNFEMALEHRIAPETYLDLGLTIYYSRRYASAIPFFQSAIRLRPQADQYVVALADAQWHAGNQEAARQSYTQALGLLERLEQTRQLDTEERCRRALCFARLGDLDSARSALVAAIAADPHGQTALYTAAVIALREDRRVAAQEHLRQALLQGFPAGLAHVDPDLQNLF